MNPLHMLTGPLSDLQVEQYGGALGTVQSNILQSHGRDHADHIFLRFAAGKRKEVRRWLAEFADSVTSANTHMQQARTDVARDETFEIGLLLTATGYEYLEPESSLAFHPWFRQGMRQRAAILHDPPRVRLESAYRGQIDAMLLLANDDHTRTKLNEKTEALKRSLSSLCSTIHVEAADQIRLAAPAGSRKKGRPLEHFGFVDGISQPLFFEREVQAFLRESSSRGVRWDPGASPGLVLVPDPLVRDEPDAYGSYVVFRKLEQNVKKLHELTAQLSTKLGGGQRAQAFALAQVVGRYADGTPLMSKPTPDSHQSASLTENNFAYAADKEGAVCPFHSHIRRMNGRGGNPRGPLGQGEGLASERTHRIARRGMTYGERTPDTFVELKKMPARGVGMLFLCYQADIDHQFEFMQSRWANRESFPRTGTGLDPFVGRPSGTSRGETPQPQSWRKLGRGPATKFLLFDCVKLKGGEYFFAPSLTYLKSLAK